MLKTVKRKQGDYDGEEDTLQNDEESDETLLSEVKALVFVSYAYIKHAYSYSSLDASMNC